MSDPIIVQLDNSVAAKTAAANAANSAVAAATSAASALNSANLAVGSEEVATNAASSIQEILQSDKTYTTAINQLALAEATGYGIVSGLQVKAQDTPNMTVSVAGGTVHMKNGARVVVAAVTALAIATADATNPRVDSIYVDGAGNIAYAQGIPANNPVTPTLSNDAIKVSDINIRAGQTSITSLDISDDGEVKARYQNLNIVSLSDYGKTDSANIDETLKKAITDIDNRVLMLNANISTPNTITVDGHHDFKIIGMNGKFIDASIEIKNCFRFDVDSINQYGSSNYCTFYVRESNYFSVRKCAILGIDNSRTDVGVEGIQIYDSCLIFDISNNRVDKCHLDGILVHNNCHYFTIHDNIVSSAGAVGIESEGRDGSGYHDVNYKRNSNGIISNNTVDGANYQGFLCLFSDNMNIMGNNGTRGISIIGSNNVSCVGNSVNSAAYGLIIGCEAFDITNPNNMSNGITIANNVIIGMQGASQSFNNIYGMDGLVSIRGASDVHLNDNEIRFEFDGIDTDPYKKISYISLASASFVSVRNNKTMSYSSTTQKGTPHYGINLYHTTRDYSTETVGTMGLSNIDICGNTLRYFVYGIGSDVPNVSTSNLASNLINVTISDNYIHGELYGGVGLCLMYMDATCGIKLGRNILRKCSNAVSTYGSTARITSTDYQDANETIGAININNGTSYFAGDTIVDASDTSVYKKVCIVPGQPGTWKNVNFSS